MPKLLNFTPVFGNDPKEIKKYYQDNNIEIPNIPYFQNYLSTESSNISNYEPEKKSFEIPIYKASDNIFFKSDKKAEKPLEKTTKDKIIDEITSMKISDEDKDYLVTMAERESDFQPNITNQFGYFGLYQFGDLAFKDTGYNKEKFAKDTKEQHKGALKLAKLNEQRLKPIISAFVGKEFNGVPVTKNGIRAMAHLLGASTVKDYFMGTTKTKFAKAGFVDGNGTHISEYLKLYA